MVHNGIEYGDMQLICEAYSILKDGLGLNHERMSEIMAEWNKGELDSFLIEISSKILGYKDIDGTHLVEKIRDSAGQKGIDHNIFEMMIYVFLVISSVIHKIVKYDGM